MRAILALIFVVTHTTSCRAQNLIDPTNTDWCKPELCKDKRYTHIACNNDKKFHKSCQNPRYITLTKECRDAILDAHNDCRNKIAGGKFSAHLPQASRMTQVQWDSTLAYLASLNVLTCEMEHEKCRNTEEFSLSGQNLGEKSWPTIEKVMNCTDFVKNRIQSWCNEANGFTSKFVEEYYRDPSFGHASSLLQDKAIYVGCAISMYETVMENWVWQNMLLACNYAHTNTKGKVWLQGKPGSQCLEGKDSKFEHLCNVKENKHIDCNKAHT